MHRPVTTQTSVALNIRTSAPKVAITPSARQMTQQKCCETGRLVMIDPMTGGTMCSCQLKSGFPTYLSRVPTLPETVYGVASTGNQFSPNVLMGTDSSSAFYQMTMKSARSTEGMKTVTSPPGLHSPYYIEHLMSTHPYTPYYPGFDLNNARRKNATRETTSALKAWLYEHRKNPYPTKGEKIMLAIITRMTLTQVSTWFANARRRLKKESKMDEKDIDLSDIDIDAQSDQDSNDHILSVNDDDGNTFTSQLSDISDTEESGSNSHHISPSSSTTIQSTQERVPDTVFEHQNFLTDRENSSSDTKASEKHYKKKNSPSSLISKSVSRETANTKTPNRSSPQPRPKIWSISEIISSDNNHENKS